MTDVNVQMLYLFFNGASNFNHNENYTKSFFTSHFVHGYSDHKDTSKKYLRYVLWVLVGFYATRVYAFSVSFLTWAERASAFAFKISVAVPHQKKV